MDNKINLIKDIHNRLKIANHYFQEYKEILKQIDSDNGKLYTEYNFSIPFIKKAYFENSLLILCTLFEKNGGVNFYKLRKLIGNNKLKRFDKFFTDFNRIYTGLKFVRDKSVAHIEHNNIEEIYQKANVTYKDVDDLLSNAQNYLIYIINSMSINLDIELTYPYNAQFGMRKIYTKL